MSLRTSKIKKYSFKSIALLLTFAIFIQLPFASVSAADFGDFGYVESGKLEGNIYKDNVYTSSKLIDYNPDNPQPPYDALITTTTKKKVQVDTKEVEHRFWIFTWTEEVPVYETKYVEETKTKEFDDPLTVVKKYDKVDEWETSECVSRFLGVCTSTKHTAHAKYTGVMLTAHGDIYEMHKHETKSETSSLIDALAGFALGIVIGGIGWGWSLTTALVGGSIGAAAGEEIRAATEKDSFNIDGMDVQKVFEQDYSCVDECIPTSYQKCDGDTVQTCEKQNDDCYDLIKGKNCNTDDGSYCVNDNKLETRDYTCSGGNCDYSVTESISCNEEYGDRSFCSTSECQSYPEALSLDWNSDDHNYNSSIHDTSGYPYCNTSTVPSVSLSWEFNSQTNDSYELAELQVSKNNNFDSSNLVDVTLGNEGVPVNSYLVSGDLLEFNTTYHWRVRVRDENDNWSNGSDYDWTYSTFETDKERVTINFSYSPTNPYSKEKVDFVNESTVGDSSINSFYWEFENGYPSSSTEENPSVEFAEKGGNGVRLEVTDSDGVTCFKTKTVGVKDELPEWREESPF